ncbi:hypothetical protein GCM10010424_43750 [Streptomyces lienomycini]
MTKSARVGREQVRSSRVDPGTAGARLAQQLEQRQQLQRARAAPWDPAVRVEASAKFASMPSRTAVHTSTVNSMTVMWDMFHLIRLIMLAKGLLRGLPGHMAHKSDAQPPLRSRDPNVIRFASARVSERDRTPGRPS